jgi:putative nucleotidyltransferase with HDIG domain
MSLTAWAYQTSERTLAAALPRRWAHVQGVALKARTVASAVGDDAQLLEAAAVLHDVGYAPDLARTGFHPLDGAYFLRSIEAPERLVHLVAHHSCAVREARLRGLETEKRAYPSMGYALRPFRTRRINLRHGNCPRRSNLFD